MDSARQAGSGDPNRTIVTASNRTQALDPGQMIEVDPNRTVIGDPNRTQMAPGDPPSRGIALSCRMENPYVHSAASTTGRALIQVTAGDAVSGKRQPLNLSLVIDRSGSMEGEPLAYVKQACAYVVDLLTPDDLLSIITFEEQVDVIMPARKIVNKDLIKQHIARITAGRTTNLYDGLAAGGAQITGVPPGGYLKRLLVLTDGEPTAGLKDFASNVSQVAALKERGVTVTTLGFGPEYNEELLAGMARRGGGNYYYISRPDLLPEVFRSELETMMTVAASNPRLVLHLPKWTEIRQVYGHSPEFGTRRVTLPLPDIERGSVLSLVAEAVYSPRPAGPYRVFQAELLYENAAAGGAKSAARADATAEFVADASLLAGHEDPVVLQHIELAQASRDIERTVMGMRTQQISPMTAMIELQKTQRLLIQQGRGEEAAEIGKAVAELQAGGGGAEKTLVGAVLNLDQGKERSGG